MEMPLKKRKGLTSDSLRHMHVKNAGNGKAEEMNVRQPLYIRMELNKK